MATEDDKARARDLASRKAAEQKRVGASKRAGNKAHKVATEVQKDVQARTGKEQKKGKSDGK